MRSAARRGAVAYALRASVCALLMAPGAGCNTIPPASGACATDGQCELGVCRLRRCVVECFRDEECRGGDVERLCEFNRCAVVERLDAGGGDAGPGTADATEPRDASAPTDLGGRSDASPTDALLTDAAPPTDGATLDAATPDAAIPDAAQQDAAQQDAAQQDAAQQDAAQQDAAQQDAAEE